MRIICWITKVTVTHSEYLILAGFQQQIGYANVLQCYVYIRMPVFLSIIVAIRTAVTPVNEVHWSASESNTDVLHSTRHANNSTKLPDDDLIKSKHVGVF